MGAISNSLYLYQQIVMQPVRERLNGFPVIVQMAFAVGVVIFLASLSFVFIEMPFLDLKTRFS